MEEGPAASAGRRLPRDRGLLGCVRAREAGLAGPPCATSRSAGGQPALLERLQLERTLEGHSGCVNTVHFSPEGDVLVSGSDDLSVILWDWQRGARLLKYDSGHVNNVFQARIMPHSDNRTIISCAADGQVRVGTLSESRTSATTVKAGQHHGRAHKLALEPGSSHCFLSSGEDGVVRHFDLREPSYGNRKLLGLSMPNSLWSSQLEIYALAINPTRPWQLALSCADEKVKVYDFRWSMGGRDSASRQGTSARRSAFAFSLCPPHLAGIHHCHTTCVAYSHSGELLATYSNEDIYLFAADGRGGRSAQGVKSGRETACHVLSVGAPLLRAVSSSADDAEAAPASAADADASLPADPAATAAVAPDELHDMVLEGAYWDDGRSGSSGLSVSSSPRSLSGAGQPSASSGSSANSGEEAANADFGASTPLRRAADEGLWPSFPQEEGGGEGVVLQRYHGHYNRRTVKGVNFLGPNDEYVISGSDCGNVFIWDKASGALLWMQEGDSRVVNCLEPHPHYPLTLATSGIDDNIKIWAPSAGKPQALSQEGRDRFRRTRRFVSARSSAYSAERQLLWGAGMPGEVITEALRTLLGGAGGDINLDFEDDTEEDDASSGSEEEEEEEEEDDDGAGDDDGGGGGDDAGGDAADEVMEGT
eukprot:jgi/Tetstr1/437693/TSEL_026348.t2